MLCLIQPPTLPHRMASNCILVSKTFSSLIHEDSAFLTDCRNINHGFGLRVAEHLKRELLQQNKSVFSGENMYISILKITSNTDLQWSHIVYDAIMSQQFREKQTVHVSIPFSQYGDNCRKCC